MSANVYDFLSNPEGRERIRQLVLRVLGEVVPEEVEVTIGYLDPLLDLAARGAMPSVDTNEEAGRFGAGDWLILVVVPIVVAEFAARLAGKGSLADSELKGWVLDSGSPLAEERLPALVRSLSAAFAEERVDAREEVER